jgi:hypothetical protein
VQRRESRVPREVLGFLVFAMLFMGWITFHPQSAIPILFWGRSSSFSPGKVMLLRVISGVNLVVCALFVFWSAVAGR